MTIDDTVTTPAELDLVSARLDLQAELARREEIVQELAPRAAPNIDPVAYMTMRDTQLVMDRISTALDRLSAGTYGSCVRCGEAIAAGRLEVLPYAETCIGCQSAVERA